MTHGTDNVGHVLVVQHQDDAPPGQLGDWAAERGVLLTVIRPDQGEPLPDPERFAAVVHHDVIEPPPFSSVIARNAFGPQAFRVGRHLGVQFHPEVTTDALAGWADRGHADLAAADVDRSRLAAQTVARAPRAARAARKLFDAFAASAHALPTTPRALSEI